MEDTKVGAGAGSPQFIQLMTPGGSIDVDLVRRADGTALGEEGTAGAVSGDTLSTATLDKTQAAINLKAWFESKGITPSEQVKILLDSIDASEPMLPVIGEYLEMMEADIASGTLTTEGTSVNLQAQVDDAQEKYNEAEYDALNAEGIALSYNYEGGGSVRVAINNKVASRDFAKETDQAAIDLQAAIAKGDENGIARAQVKAQMASENANKAAADADLASRLAIGTPGEETARKAADEAKVNAEKANGNLIDINARAEVATGEINAKKQAAIAENLAAEAERKTKEIAARGETATAETESNLETATAAADKVTGFLDEAKEAATKGDPAMARASAENARRYADDANQFAVYAEANALRAVGTPSEASARELADKAKEVATRANLDAAFAEGSVREAEKVALGNQSAEDIARETAIVDSATADAAQYEAEAAAMLKSDDANKIGKAQILSEKAAQARDIAKAASDRSMAIAEHAEAEGVPGAGALYNQAKLNTETVKNASASALNAANGVLQAAPTERNLWLAVNAYTVFLVNFMDLLVEMMKNKELQSKVQIQSMNMMFSLAKDTADTIMKAAEIQAQTYFTAAICSAVALAGSVVSIGMTTAGAAKSRQPEVKLESRQIPAGANAPKPPGEFKPVDPHSSTNTSLRSAWYKKEGGSIVKKTNPDTGLDEPVPLRDADGNVKQNLKTGEIEYEYGPQTTTTGPRAGFENTAKGQKQMEKFSKETDDIYVNSEGLTKNQQIAARVEYDNYVAQLKANGLEDPADPKISTTEEKVRQDAIEKRNTEIEAEVKAENKEIRASNDRQMDTLRGLGTAIGQMGQHSGEVYKNLIMSANETLKAKEEGIKQMLEALKNLSQQVLSTANDAFRARGEDIQQLIQQLDSMRQKLNEAVAAMLRK